MCECHAFLRRLHDQSVQANEVVSYVVSEHALTCKVMIDVTVRLMCLRLDLGSVTTRLVRRVISVYDYILQRLNQEFWNEGEYDCVRTVSQVVILFHVLKVLIGDELEAFLRDTESLYFVALLHLISSFDMELCDVPFSYVANRLGRYQHVMNVYDVDVYLLVVMNRFSSLMMEVLTNRALFDSTLITLFLLSA